jgi:hypothetical protein
VSFESTASSLSEFGRGAVLALIVNKARILRMKKRIVFSFICCLFCPNCIAVELPCFEDWCYSVIFVSELWRFVLMGCKRVQKSGIESSIKTNLHVFE